MSFNRPPLSCNIEINNNSYLDSEFSIKDQFSYALLPKSDDFVLSVTRISIPSARIKSFIISDARVADYYMSIISSLPGNNLLFASPQLTSFPNSSGTISDGVTTEFVGAFEYFDPADVVSTLNSMMVNSYYKMVSQYNNKHEFGPQLISFNGTANSYNHTQDRKSVV